MPRQWDEIDESAEREGFFEKKSYSQQTRHTPGRRFAISKRKRALGESRIANTVAKRVER